MTKQLFRTTSELPPKPDPVSGEPRPPRAPGFHKEDKPPKDQDRDRDQSTHRMPTPPEGEGRMLEWYRHSQRSAITAGLIAFGIITLGITAMQGFILTWMTFWWMWIGIALGSLGVYGSFRTVDPAVGAEWLKVGKAWVRLYELTEIKARHRSNAIHLDFTDSAGRKVMVKSDDIQEDRDMWDLVYNGILHSVITSNADTNKLIHSAFRVPRREDSIS
ncbi:hypothetical protein FHX42_004016 [Saccharopolyspora lacisalsi]|uniref:Uncharacterized protein n=1 Tax=Halosaccharopolyspora lacisalsi TaxID=1000566 RepID=A0A839E4I1_9PSEU|nr:hypothetical protein [Halosaccharopolyspora lacisalsi]MBA8826637.1 hypothetical protein [Halosaccharopolyspora lacisalsi]